jgi:hypothetical protein
LITRKWRTGFARQNDFAFQPSDGKKIHIFSRSGFGEVREQFVDRPGSLTIRRFDLQAAPSLLFSVVHLPSKVHWNPDDQSMNSPIIAADIRRVEKDLGHERTIVTGDFNMNPYEPGIAGRQGFSAVMTRRESGRATRTIQGREYPVFYNPMWKFFRDAPGLPSGSFYHRGSSPTSHPWNIYDQVLVRPSLADSVAEVDILSGDGSDSFVTSHGIPFHRPSMSDHLPLIFAINFPGDSI